MEELLIKHLKDGSDYQIFRNIFLVKLDYCLPSSNKSKYFLKELGVKNIKFIGNLKFSQSENEKTKINDNLKKFSIQFKKSLVCI